MIIEAIIVGIVAWVFVFILMDSGMIFEKWWVVLNKLPQWLSKPLGACGYCFAGQLAFWYYLIHELIDGTYNALYHIAFVSIAILTVRILNHILNNNNRTWN